MNTLAGHLEEHTDRAYSAARVEASRCLFCFDAPCKTDCPAGIDVPGFIRRILQRNLQGAYQLIHRENPLSWVCGVLCPTERLCASRCPRKLMDNPIRIGGLQAFASEAIPFTPPPKEEEGTLNRPVAIVGAGPAGLTAALFLSREGWKVDLYEAEELPGGLILYGIRPDKVNKKRVLQEIERLLDRPRLSIHLKTRISDPHNLLKDHQAVYVATGLGTEKVDGRAARFKNVYSATGFLKEVNKAFLKGKNFGRHLGVDVLAIGGGNTAMDAAITAHLAGASRVTIVYRRTENEMPAWKHELDEVSRHGLYLRFLLEPVSFRGRDGKIDQVMFRPTRLGRPGPDGRRKVVAGEGPNVLMKASSVILATGRERETPSWAGKDRIDPAKGRLGKSKIWFGGEFRHGVGLIVQAVADGKRTALEIIRTLEEE
jgi:NADPH-dependent glutamate synthase beta subunit-like oxidoreductase